LTNRLAEFCVAPPVLADARRLDKYVLREEMRFRIPESVRARRVKFNFRNSMRRRLAGPLAESARAFILDRPLGASGRAQMDRVESALNRHTPGEGDYSKLLLNAA